MVNHPKLLKKINWILSHEYKYFLNKYSVVGIALGFKTVNGFKTPKYSIKIYVSKKIPSNKILKRDLVPSYYKGIQTDIIETGIIKSNSYTNRVRPVPCGYNIGAICEQLNGTLGCVVTDGQYDYVLSCNHVLSDFGRISPDTPIIQPSEPWGGSHPRDLIGRLSNSIKINFITPIQEPKNIVDCAIAKITGKSLVSPKLPILGYINKTKYPTLGEPVQKIGYMTELTKGMIDGINAVLDVNFNIGKALFVNQIITTSMSLNGDSGAILLDKNKNALGLLMSNSNSHTFFNPIQYILSDLNVKIVTSS